MHTTQTTAEAADTTVTTTSDALATQITSEKDLQNEFASTIKICELGLLCAGSAKAAKALNGALKVQAAKLPVPKKVHLNSNQYRGDTHVYKIRSITKGIDYKIGESAQGLNNAGLSKRWEMQARKLQRETGDEFKSEIIKVLPGKREARQLETELIQEARKVSSSALLETKDCVSMPSKHPWKFVFSGIDLIGASLENDGEIWGYLKKE